MLVCVGAGRAGPPVEDLVARATAAHLAAARYWHILLHYEKALTGVQSQIDDPAFFLAADGMRNPQAELTATIRALFGEQRDDDEPAAVCRFPARYAWLSEQLGLTPAELPACERLQRTLAELAPVSVALVFPDAFMNSPASMFGHTLLNIRGRDRSELLARSVNYSARTDETRGMVFAVKGLFGAYPGYYEFHPYYTRVQQYNDINQRHIWEYQLTLTPTEVLRLVRHVWELQEIYTDYYFLDDNCSYNLLYLIEAARPEVHLTRQFSGYAIPLDTIRAIDRAGLIERRVFRPSRAATVRALAADLSLADQAVARRLAAGQADPATLTGDATPRVLELGSELLQLRYAEGQVTQEVYRQRLLPLLRARSSHGKQPKVVVPEPPAPEDGHRSALAAVGFDVVDGRYYQQLSLRPAYHGLLDPEAGRPLGSEIEFGHLRLQYDASDRKLELDRFTAIGITSIDARDAFFKPHSWKVAVGLDNRRFSARERHHVAFINPGRGLAWRLGPGLVYGFVEAEALAGGALDDSYAAGAGGSLGWLATVSERLGLHLQATALTYPLGHRHERLSASAEARWTLTSNLALTTGVRREQQADGVYSAVNGGLRFYW